MESTILKDRQEAFFNLVVEVQKQRYLKDKAELEGVLVPFDFAQAYIFPFAPRDDQHKDALFAMMVLFCAAKNIRRIGYFADTWQAEESKVQPRHNPKRRECFIWGLANPAGPETYYHQEHNSRNHTLVGKVVTRKDGLHLGRSRFIEILPNAAKVDWARIPEMSKESIVQNTLSYFGLEKPYDVFGDFE